MSDKILVGIRVRPLINRETQDASTQIHWAVGEENKLTHVDPVTKKPVPTATPYKFDRVFGDSYNNEDIYTEVAEPILESALAGFNGTIFAYGQTSSGKTFTMMGDKSAPGVIPLAINHIFQYIEHTPDREFLIRASFMEIYNENITDLLATGLARTKGLSVREDSSGQVYVADLKEECCNSEEVLYTLMDKGNKNRTVGQTNMNDRSSRSHTIFRIILESRERSDTDHTEEAVTVSHLNLVDLAGSENASQTGASGQRLKEGGFINSSLFMLGRVISQLSDGESYVNFRDSKLTRILQSSLGGNAKTAIICTVTPASVEQTHSTLRFASRAKSIKNNAVVNEVLNDAALLKRYANKIAALQKMLENEKNTDKAQEVEKVKEKLDEEASKNQELTSKNQELLTKINSMKEKLVVSSILPTKEVVDKRKKLRRETWAAPAQRRAMRMSCAAPLKLEPLRLGGEFLKPVLPPWSCGNNTSRGSISSPPHSTPLFDSPPRGIFDNSKFNSSSASMGFGQDAEGLFDMAEESILARHEQDDTFDSLPEVPTSSKRIRRVKFDTGTPPKTYNTVECQTEDSLLPQNTGLLRPNMSFTTPSRGFGTPFSASGTPRNVLRDRYKKLQEECEEKDEWLSDWKGELDDLTEFQKLELKLREESFMGKLEVGVVDEEMVDELNKEISSLRKSMIDTEGLLLDSNKSLSQRNQDVVTLKNQLEELTKDHIAADTLKEELNIIQNENTSLKKESESQKQQISFLQNERNDFDMMMELALEKQKRVERDLRLSLDDAWEEIANLEGDSKDAVRKRSEKISTMESELLSLRESNQGKDMEKQLSDMKYNLEETETKYQNALKDLQAQDEKLEQLQKLVSCMAELEAKVSGIEHLESQVNQSLLEKQQLSEENVLQKKENEQLKVQVNKSSEESLDLRTTINGLQTELDHKALLEPTEEGTPEAYQNKITELQEEVDYLRNKLDESCFSVPRLVGMSPCLPRLLSASSRSNLSIVPPSELSRKLSETIHALEESLLSPITITPTKNSVSSMDDQFLDQQELHTIKDQLIALQSALMSQEFDLQLQMESYKFELEYHNQVILNNETEKLLWEMQDIFSTEYYTSFIINNGHALKQIIEQQHKNTSQQYESTACLLKPNSRINESDANSSFTFGFAKKCVDKSLDSTSKVCYVSPMSANFTLNDTFETSILNLDTDHKTENKELKHQLEILNSENVTMFEKINVLEKKHSEMCEKTLLEAAEEKLKEKEILKEEIFKIEKERDNLEVTLNNMKIAFEDLKKRNSTPSGNMVSKIGKYSISKEEKMLKNSVNSMSPMSLACDLQASQDDMVIDSTLDNSSVSQESDSKYSTVSMDMTMVRATSESSPGFTQNSIIYSPGETDTIYVNRDHTGNTESSPGGRQNSSSSSVEMDVTNVNMNPAGNTSIKNDSDNEKFSKLEQKVESLSKENSVLKEKIKEMIDEENYKVIQNLKCEVKEVCEEKVKLEKVKEEIYDTQSDIEKECAEKNISKDRRVQEVELQLAEKEDQMKTLRCKVEELMSVIESQKSTTKNDLIDSITNKYFATDNIANKLQTISGNSPNISQNNPMSLNKLSLTRKSLAPMSLADELRGLDVSINETIDTSVLPNLSFSQSDKQRKSLAPMSLADELKAMEMSINETFETSILSNTSISHSTKRKISIVPMSLADELKAMESSINNIHKSTVNLESNSNEEIEDLNIIQRLENEIQELKNKLSCLQESDDHTIVPISTNNSDTNLEKVSQLEKKVEVLMAENLTLKELIQDQLDEEKGNEIQDLKCKVKEVCDEKVKLEEEKENLKIELADSRSTLGELNKEVDNIQSGRVNEDLEKSMSKTNRIQELESQLTQNEIGMKKLEGKVQELISEIELLRSKSNVDYTNSVTNESNAPEYIENEAQVNDTDESDIGPKLSMSINQANIPKKSLAPMSMADELRGLDVTINETIDTSVLPNLSFSQGDKQRKSLAPMSLADELKAMEVSINETFETSILSNTSISHSTKRKVSIVPMSLADELKAMESSINITHESTVNLEPNSNEERKDLNIIQRLENENQELKIKLSCLQESDDHTIVPISTNNSDNNLEKISQLEKKVEVLMAENLTLKELIKEQLNEGKGNEIQDLKCKVKVVCDEKLKLEEEKENLKTELADSRSTLGELNKEVNNIQSGRVNEDLEKSMSKTNRIQELESQLTQNEMGMKKLEGKVQELISEIELLRSKSNVDYTNSVTIESNAPEYIENETQVNDTDESDIGPKHSMSINQAIIQRKSLAPISMADELRGLDVTINETIDTSVLPNLSFSQSDKQRKSLAPMSLADELKAMEVSINETFETSIVSSSSAILKNKSRKSIAPMSLADELKAMERSIDETLESSVMNLCPNTDEENKVLKEKIQLLEKEIQDFKGKLSCLQEAEDKPIENISTKFSELEQRIEVLTTENLSLKENIKELSVEERYTEIQDLKCKVKEVCDQKLKLEEEKDNLKIELAKSRTSFDDLKEEVENCKSEEANEILDKSVSKASQVNELESQLAENEFDMKKLEGRVSELVSEIEALKNKTKDNGPNPSNNESLATDSIENELIATNSNTSVINLNVSIPLNKVSIPRKSLVPMSLADELCGLNVSINETFDTSVFSNNSYSHNHSKRKSFVPMSLADELKAMEDSINETFETSVNFNLSTHHENKPLIAVAPIVLVDEFRTMECSIDETFESSTVNMGSNIDEENKTLREKLHVLENENKELKDKVSNLQEAVDNYCLQTDVIADKLEIEKELDEMKAQFVDLDNRSVDNAELQTKMEKLMNEKQLLEEELEEYKLVKSKENCEQIEELKTNIYEICKEKCALEEEKNNLENSLSKSRAVFSDIQSESETLESESIKKEMEKRLLCEESKVSDLEIKLNGVEKEKERLEKVVEEQTARIGSLKTRRERRVENCKTRRTSRLSVVPMSLANELSEKDSDSTISDIPNTSSLSQDNPSIIDELRNVSLDFSETFRTCIEESKTRLSVGHVSFGNITTDEFSQEITIHADMNLETSVNCENQLYENKALKEEMNNLKASISKLELEKNLLERRLSESRIAYEDLQSLRWQVDSLKEEKEGLEQNVKEAQNLVQELEVSVKSRDKEIKKLEVKLKEIISKEPKEDDLSESKQDSGVNSVNETLENCIESDVMELKSPEKYKLEKRLQLASNKLADANLQFATIEEFEAQMKLIVIEREQIQIENDSLLDKVRQLESEKVSSDIYEKEVKNLSIQTFEDNDKSNDIELEIKLLREKLNASENDRESLKSHIEELTSNEKEKDLMTENELSFIGSSKSLHNGLNDITVGLNFNETVEGNEISTSIAPLSLADELREMDVEINETLDKSEIGREYINETVESVSFAKELHSADIKNDNFELASLCEIQKENKELKEKINTILAEKSNLVENFEYEVKTLREKLNDSEIKTTEIQRTIEENNSHLTSQERKETEEPLPDKAISSGINLVNESLDMSMEENTPSIGSNKDSDCKALPSLADELLEFNTTSNEVINTTLSSQNDNLSWASTEVDQTTNESSAIAIIDENNQLKQKIDCLTLENEHLVEKIDKMQKILSTDNESANNESVEANSLRQTVTNLETQVKLITEEKSVMEKKIVEKEHLHSENEKLEEKIKLLESNSQEDDLEEMVMRLTEKEEELDSKIGEMKEAMEEKDDSLSDIRKDLDEKLHENEELTKLTEKLSKDKDASDGIILELKKELEEVHELVKDKENAVLQLKQQIEEATNEISALKTMEMDILQGEIDTSKQGNDVKNYQEEVDEKLKSALSQLTEAHSTLDSKDKELVKLQTTQDSLIKQVEELSNSLNANEIEYTKLLEEKSSLHNQLRENNLEFDKLETKEKELESAEEQIENLKMSIFDTEIKINKTESELEDTKATLEKVIAAHTIELEEMSQKLREIETSKSDNNETQNILSQRMGELKELEDKHEQILKEHHNLQIAYDNLNTLLTSKTDELANITDEQQKQIETFLELIQQKDNEISTFEEKTSKTSESLSVLQSEIEAKNCRINHMETEVEEYKRRVTEKEQELELLVENSKTLNDKKILELEADNEHISKLHQEVCQDKENMTQLIQSNKDEMKKLLESVESKEKELSVVVLERNELEKIKEELDSQLKLKGTENENLSRDLKDTKIQIDNIKITLTGKDVELAQISNELIQLQEKIEKLEISKAESEEKISSLSVNLELEQSSLKMKENEAIILQKEKHDISNRLEKVMETGDLMEKEISDLNSRYVKSEENLKNLEDMLKIKEKEESNGTSQMIEVQAELDKLKKCLEMKEEEISKVHIECLGFKEKLDVSEITIKEKVEEVLKLSSELKVLKVDQGNLELMQSSLKIKENESIKLQKEQSEITTRLEKMIETTDLKEKEINDLNIRFIKSEENLKNLENLLVIKEKEESKIILGKDELQTELDELKKNLNMKEDDVSKVQLDCLTLKEQLNVSENTIKEKVEEVLQLSSELKVVKDDHDKLEFTLKNKNEEFALHQENNKTVKQELKEITEESKLKVDKIIDLQKDLENKEVEMKCQLSVKENLEIKCEESEKALVLVREKFKAVNLEKEELLLRFTELENNYHAKEDELENVVVEANEMASAIENMQEKITELESSVASLEEDVNEKSEKISSLELEKQTMEEEFSKNGENWTKEEEKLVGVIEKYEVEVSEKAAQIEKHEAEISEKDSLIEELNEDKTKYIQETNQKMSIFIKEKEEYSVEIKALNSKYILLQEQQKENHTEKQMDDECKQKYELEILKYLNENADLNTKLATLESELKAEKLLLIEKEEECDKLNLEIEEVMEHYKKELKVYAEMYNEENKKLTEVKGELSHTQTKLSDLSLQKDSFSHTPDQSVMVVQKKLADREAEVSRLIKEKQRYDQENESLKENNKKVLNEKMELLNKVNVCEKELEKKNGQFDTLADECSDWKQQYSKLFEEKEEINKKLIESVKELKHPNENKGLNSSNASDIEDLKKQLSSITNEKDNAEKKLKQLDANYDLLERDYEQLREDSDALEEKGINMNSFTLLKTKCADLEKELHSLKEVKANLGPSQLSSGNDEDLKNQLCIVKGEKEAVEKKLKQIDENYDLLESDYLQLREDCDVLDEQGINLQTFTDIKNKCEKQEKEIENLKIAKTGVASSEISGGSMEAINLLKRQNQSLKVENEKLKKQQKEVINKSRESLGADDSLKEKLLSVERKNNELNMKLKALDAPSKKEVLRLTEELRISNLKMNQMRGELRRVQNTKTLDSTICDFQVKKMIKEEAEESPGAAPMDFSTGSSIVQEVQVIALENKVYHLERDMKKLKEENTAMEQHVDHYKAKAQEWRDKATKINHYSEKHKKDVESLRKDNIQMRTKLEETNAKIESQRFDLGHKREVIEKLEKEKKEYITKYSRSANHEPVSMRHSQLPTLKESEPKPGDGTETQSSSGVPRGVSRRTSILNTAPLPSQTRIERLPGAGSGAQGQQVADSDKVPMWQMVGKENKDYSKYRQSTGSRRKSEEDCKQQ